MANSKKLQSIPDHPLIGHYCRPSRNGKAAEIVDVLAVNDGEHYYGYNVVVPTTAKVRFESGRTQNLSLKRVIPISPLEILGASSEEPGEQ